MESKGQHSHNPFLKGHAFEPSNRAGNHPTNKPRSPSETPPIVRMLVHPFSAVPEPRHFYPSAEPIIIRLPCPQMAIVEMEAPFSQINFEKYRHQSYTVHCMSLVSIQVLYDSQNPSSSRIPRSFGVSSTPNSSQCAGITISPSRISSASSTVLRRTRSSKASSST